MRFFHPPTASVARTQLPEDLTPCLLVGRLGSAGVPDCGC